MAEKKGQIIIKKVIKGGHGAAHGGAWKVAYADFVTAMMCFFLVMWLMGADEETKAAISAYFNNPTATWRPELKDNENIPLGNQTGAGESVLKGANGQVPDPLVPKPLPVIPPDNKAKVDADGALTSEEISTADTLSFSFNEDELFPTDESSDISQEHALRLMTKIGKVARAFNGPLIIRGLYDDHASGSFELENGRLVAVENFIAEQKWLAQDLMRTSLRKRAEADPESPRRPASANRRIELVFMK